MSLKVMFVDMNAYFASVEQQYRPELRNRPVAVVPVQAETTCCIAASYEAKAFGIKTGTLVGDARRMCPGIVMVEARHELYVRVHHAIVAAVESCLPVERVHSIDELSCRLSDADQPLERALRKGREVKDAIRGRVGEHLRCSVGLAPNTFLAKVAGDMKKPDGLTVIAPEDLPRKLYPLELMDFPGIGPRMHRRLVSRGVQTVEQLCALSPDELERHWGGVVGKRFWHALHGHDMPTSPTPRRSVSHSHVLPPELRNEKSAQGVLMRLVCKAAARMRRLGYCANRLDVYVSFRHGGGWHVGMSLNGCQDTSSLIDAFMLLWKRRSTLGQPFKVGMVLSELVAEPVATQPLFVGEQRQVALSRMMDRINGRYGRDMVHVGTVHEFLDSAPTRIAFSNVPDLDDPANWDDEGDDLAGLVESSRREPPQPVTAYEPEFTE